MSDEQTEAMKFDCGLTQDEKNEIDDIGFEIVKLKSRIEELGRHRHYSLAITKLEEAKLWLRDRRHVAP